MGRLIYMLSGDNTKRVKTTWIEEFAINDKCSLPVVRFNVITCKPYNEALLQSGNVPVTC